MSIKSVKDHLSIIAPDLEISEFKESTATVEQAVMQGQEAMSRHEICQGIFGSKLIEET